MTAFLPHEDPHAQWRERRLRRARRRYRFCHTHVSPLAIIRRVPPRERFAFGWLIQAARHVRVVIRNRLMLEGDSRSAIRMEKDYKALTGILRSRAGYFAAALRHFVYEALLFKPRVETARRPEVLEEYAALFRAIGLPPVRDDLHDDRTFAWLRVAGPNPLTLHRVTTLDDRFPVSDSDFRVTLPSDSLAAAGAEGRLYLADFAALADVEPGDFPHGRKYLYAPLALFAVERHSRQLVPVAIQCGQVPGPEAPIFTPADGYNWLIAKTIVEIADANCTRPSPTWPARICSWSRSWYRRIGNSPAITRSCGCCSRTFAERLRSTRRLGAGSSPMAERSTACSPARSTRRGSSRPTACASSSSGLVICQRCLPRPG